MISFFSFFVTNVCLPRRLEYAALWAANQFVGSKTPKDNAFDQFWKFEFHFEDFWRNTQFLNFGGPSNYLYLFKNHRETFPWPGERPSSHIKVTKIWFAPNIKYLSESFFVDFCHPEVISCIWYEKYLCWFRANSLKSNEEKFQFMILSRKNHTRQRMVIYSITVKESNEVILLGII